MSIYYSQADGKSENCVVSAKDESGRSKDYQRVPLPFNLYLERSHVIFVSSQTAQTLRENLHYYKMAFFRRRLWNLKLSEKNVR